MTLVLISKVNCRFNVMSSICVVVLRWLLFWLVLTHINSVGICFFSVMVGMFGSLVGLTTEDCLTWDPETRRSNQIVLSLAAAFTIHTHRRRRTALGSR